MRCWPVLSSSRVLIAAMDILAELAADAAPVPATPQRKSTEERWAVIALKKHGLNKSKIAAALKMQRSTVAAILARYDATGSPLSGARSGRPRVLSAADADKAVSASQAQPFDTPRAIRRKLDLNCSNRTVDRVL